MGQEKGSSYYPKDWFLKRIQEHIDMKDQCEIFLAQDNNTNEIIAHTIARVEKNEELSISQFGYFSTIYVAPSRRRQGVARKMIIRVNDWCKDRSLPFVTYSTAKDHFGLIKLLEECGYKKTIETDEMIRLKKVLNEN
jgi:GNAT superfamily N-acetyltransferase